MTAKEPFQPRIEPALDDQHQGNIGRVLTALTMSAISLVGLNRGQDSHASAASLIAPSIECGPGYKPVGDECIPDMTSPPTQPPHTFPSETPPATYNTTPQPTNPGNTSSTPTTTKPIAHSTTTIEIPVIAADLDGDGFPSLYQGYVKVENGYDVDDGDKGSPDGPEKLKQDMADRGLSWDALNPDEQAVYNGIALTTSYGSFSARMPNIYGVTVTIPATAEVTTIAEPTTSETATTTVEVTAVAVPASTESVAEESELTVLEIEETSAVIDVEEPSSSNENSIAAVVVTEVPPSTSEEEGAAAPAGDNESSSGLPVEGGVLGGTLLLVGGGVAAVLATRRHTGTPHRARHA